MDTKSLSIVTPMLDDLPEEELWLSKFNSGHTRNTYKQAIQQFIRIFGITRFEQFLKITNKDVTRYREFLEENGYNGASIRNKLSALSSLYKHLETKHLTKKNPVHIVERPQLIPKKPILLSLKDGRKILDAPNKVAEDTRVKKGLIKLSPFQQLLFFRDQAVLSVLLYTGCKVTELCNLKIGDYLITAEGHPNDLHELKFTLKGERLSQERYNRVILNKDCSNAIDKYLKVSNHDKEINSPLFFSRKKDLNGNLRKLTREQIFRIWRKYAKYCNIEETSPHSARQTLGSHFLNNGYPIEDLQKWFGHRNINSTKAYDLRNHHSNRPIHFVMKY